MKLYFRPLACSLSSRITAYETEQSLELVEVIKETRRGRDGVDYLTIHALGMVPALVLDGGDVLTENAAILQYLANLAPERGLVPADERGRAFLRQWLSFIGAELHEAYIPLMDRSATPEVKAYAQKRLEPRLTRVADHLADRRYLLADFSIADPYLFAVLNWTQVTTLKLDRWPALTAFMARMLERPAVQRAFGEERELYIAELARTRA